MTSDDVLIDIDHRLTELEDTVQQLKDTIDEIEQIFSRMRLDTSDIS